MTTSAEQVHHGALNTAPQPGSDARLFVDLDICASAQCAACEVKCSYYYHPGNNGIASVIELASYALVCRRCEEPHCIHACPREALEQDKEKGRILVRHTSRCVRCGSCSHACPYGTIYPENLSLLTSNCDFCLDRRHDKPTCIASCPHGALALKHGDIDLDENTFLLGDSLIVHSTHWNREKA